MSWDVPAEFLPVGYVPKRVAPAAVTLAQADEGEQQVRTTIESIARKFIAESVAADRHPSQQAIGDYVAKRMREQGIMGVSGAPLAGSYIKRHYLKGISTAAHRSKSTSPRRGK